MTRDNLHTKEEQSKLLKDKPEVIEMYKVVKVKGKRFLPLFFIHRYAEYVKGVNIAPDIYPIYWEEQKGFHCFFSKDDAKMYKTSMCRTHPCFGEVYRVIKVYVNKKDVLVTGVLYCYEKERMVGIVSKLEIKEFPKSHRGQPHHGGRN